MAVTAQLVDQIQSHIGAAAPPVSGLIDALTSRRYARAIGEVNPLYLDSSYARDRGYRDVLVPPNFLPSYLDWTDGGAEDGLRRDGTIAADMEWLPTEGVRIMGGGEDMTFHAPLVAGTEVVLTSELVGVTAKTTKSGSLMVVFTIENTYTTTEGEVVMVSSRTILGR